MIRFGLDRLLESPELLRGQRYGLLSHQASVTADLAPAHLALRDAGVPPTVLFAPEHGFYGVEQDMIPAVESSDPLSGLPVVSLYGDNEDSLRPAPGAFAGLDLLVVDLQDVGARYYTFVATAVWAAEVAIAEGLSVLVLDRPNPLGGDVVEGNLPEPGYESFVSAFSTPVRHGLTLAELMRLEAKRRDWPAEGLRVLEMEGWKRSMLWPELGRPWIAPSPNMPTFETSVIYPGGCLIEATQVSEGRGTTRPFQLVGAPHIDPAGLAEALDAFDIEGARFVPTYFRPQFQKHAGAICGGVEIVVDEPSRFQGFRCGVLMLQVLLELDREGFAWRDEPYEFVIDRPAIDLLAGTDRLRLVLEAGDGQGLESFVDSWRADERAFKEMCAEALLYGGGRGD